MKVIPALVLSLWCASGWTQSEVFLCVDENGRREWKNTGATTGCKKVELPKITNLPPAPKIHFEKAKIGMSKDKVSKAVGKPSTTRKVETRAGITERWTYPSGKVLTFSNGILEMIEK